MASDRASQDNSLPRDDKISHHAGVGNENENDLKSKDLEASLVGIDEAATLPPGTIDPVYEAKARVLNHAVRTWRPFLPT
jgi:hypothetical protein